MRKLVLKLIQKWLLEVETNIKPGDLIHVGDSDAVYDSIGIYYNYQLHPFMFFRDGNGYIYSKPVYECKRAITKGIMSV